MGRLFGTDGARGVANTELSCELALQIGRAAAMVLTRHQHRRAKLVIGKDPRISSDMLESALTAGICSVGADVLLLGVVPTPAVAYLVELYQADAGVMISASHNPAEYNGIKLFNGQGYKLPDQMEEEIEAIILDRSEPVALKTGGEIGRASHCHTAVEDYVAHLKSTVDPRSFRTRSRMRVAVDCANGSASATAPQLFRNLGIDFDFFSSSPDGLNINDHCGSTHTDALSELVLSGGYDMGIAFDGDADRCLAVDEKGELVDGDQLIALFAQHLKAQGKLSHDTAVVTVMSNLGFFRFAEKNHITAVKTKVGDRYVLEEMRRCGYSIGGEQSGHIIFTQHMTTGDGQLSALQLLSILRESGEPLSKLSQCMERYPQVIYNVKVGPEKKAALAGHQQVQDAIRQEQDLLGEDGRVLVRPSGTEPLVRVMVEGKNRELINQCALRIAAAIEGM